MIKPLSPNDRHESMRGYFVYALHEQMRNNQNIILITGDLGYGMFDKIERDFPDRFINVGASEQAALGIAIGMALKGKVPFVYSITPFVLYRPFEWIRNYLNHENIPVFLVGGGRDRDYAHDGITHWSEDAKMILDALPNIDEYWPSDKESVSGILTDIILAEKPAFLSLTR